MQYAIELYFDPSTEGKLQSLIQKIADAGISTRFPEWKTRPHITLACFSDAEERECSELLQRFARRHRKIPAYLDSVGMFTDSKVIFASPTMNREMFDLQRELHQDMHSFDTTGWEWYTPDNWVPHCTLAMTGDDPDDAFFRAADLVLHAFEKTEGEYTAIGLVKITFPVQEIVTFELGAE